MRAILEHKSKEFPIELEEVKEYFALFESDEEIAKLLQNAIENIELQTGVSLQKKTWKIIHDNPYVTLNYGPVLKILSITDSNSNPVEPISVKRASDNVILQFKDDCKTVKIRYEAGYDVDTLPECLKHSLLEKFWDIYSQGFDNSTSSNSNILDHAKNSINANADCEAKYVFKF